MALRRCINSIRSNSFKECIKKIEDLDKECAGKDMVDKFLCPRFKQMLAATLIKHVEGAVKER